MLDVCLRHAPGGEEVTRKALREHLLREGPVLERHLDTLAVLAGASPLLGLLGTVSGMIRMFEAITRFGTGDPGLLAGGISEALITTQVGLAIAIPLLLVHNHLRNRANHLLGDMDLCAVTFVNRLWPRE